MRRLEALTFDDGKAEGTPKEIEQAWLEDVERRAAAEIADAAVYIEAHRDGFRELFLSETKSAEALLLAFLRSVSPLRRGFRRLVVNKFPCVIIYRVDADIIRVFAVAHHKRRLGYWRRRAR